MVSSSFRSAAAAQHQGGTHSTASLLTAPPPRQVEALPPRLLCLGWRRRLQPWLAPLIHQTISRSTVMLANTRIDPGDLRWLDGRQNQLFGRRADDDDGHV
eukprot:CAMPEP_0115515962 /NCGR_PEP_ID=MMETSP0271-20121206/76508_1 /TAXON_ID=71861 /ORGANISM="Scrippsiella trochoidea, Strain CCMP3099" /LENGTH=100 /DNA_ID=CAMNT_0002946593 /DNA_START=123 /DNA_END=422 /DNA_ORIENTATION=+